MARLNVNPTRMELKRLKARLATTKRGHKLLKDKSDEMVRIFSQKLKYNYALRCEIEKDIAETFGSFSMALSSTDQSVMELAFSMPSFSYEVDASSSSCMGVDIPNIQINATESSYPYPYALSAVTSEADYAVDKVSTLTEKMIRLAEVEKSVRMLAQEIEKNKRRVNAMEYFMIPQLEETIKYITLKLDENDRSSKARLMKVKDKIN